MTRLPASVSTLPNLPGLSQMLVSSLALLDPDLANPPPALSLAFPVSTLCMFPERWVSATFVATTACSNINQPLVIADLAFLPITALHSVLIRSESFGRGNWLDLTGRRVGTTARSTATWVVRLLLEIASIIASLRCLFPFASWALPECFASLVVRTLSVLIFHITPLPRKCCTLRRWWAVSRWFRLDEGFWKLWNAIVLQMAIRTNMSHHSHSHSHVNLRGAESSPTGPRSLVASFLVCPRR